MGSGAFVGARRVRMNVQEMIDTDAAVASWRTLLAGTANSPAYLAHERRMRRVAAATAWMRRVPLVGNLMRTFWYGVLDEGLVETCRPRWGVLTFAFLNDGYRPTIYHAALSVLRPSTPLYLAGAPSWPRLRVLQS